MDIIITNKLVNILLISTVFSVIQMTFIQKCKKFKCIKKECHILILNIVTSFIFGIPFAMWFYELSIYDSIWISIFSFIGAPSIYQTLKKQNIIKYQPESLDNTISVPKENEIKKKAKKQEEQEDWTDFEYDEEYDMYRFKD